jgi:hypothetical protein
MRVVLLFGSILLFDEVDVNGLLGELGKHYELGVVLHLFFLDELDIVDLFAGNGGSAELSIL